MALSLEVLLLEVGKALAPLTQRLGAGEVSAFFAEIGLPAPNVVLGAERVKQSIGTTAQSLAKLPAVLSDLAKAIELENGEEIVHAGARAVPLIAGICDAISTVAAEIGKVANDAGPSRAEVESFAAEFAKRLFGVALASYLERERPTVAHLLSLFGIIEHSEHAATPAAPAHRRHLLRFDRLVGLVDDPVAVLAEAHRWGTAEFDWDTFLGSSADFFARISSFAFVQPGPPPTLRIALIDLMPADGPLPGIQAVLRVGNNEELDANVPIDGALALFAQAKAKLQAGTAITFLPPADLRVVPPAGEVRGNLRLGVQATHAANEPALVLFGVGSGARIEARQLRVAVGSDLAWDPSLRHAAGKFVVETAIEDAKAFLDLSDADGFLASVLPTGLIEVQTDLLVRWSSATGFQFDGEVGLHTTQRQHRQLGPLRLDGVDLALTTAAHWLTSEVTVTVAASIGPVTASIDGVGVAATLSFPDSGGNLGISDLSPAFRPPRGVGLSIEAPGLTGGGFFSHDAALGQYAGVMQLSLQDQLTLKAFGLIATRMPDGSRGYSLLVFITAEDFRPVPLGLGFTLQAIGGMLAVNRTFDQDVLRAGLKNDTLGTLLFPRDPVGNAPALIAALGAAFPARRGSYLLGLLVRIGWMTPTLVQIDLALVLEFGARRRLLALGRISSILPTRDNDLVRLNLDALGVLDFDAGTLAVDAVLVDSRLAQRFPIIGSAALRAGWSANADFVLTAGGFNPHFVAPIGLPRQERLAIVLAAGDNPRLTCEAYWAITADTYQFGARAHAYAEALGFAVEGDVGFDVLVVPVPLHFIADFHASVQLKRGSHNLFKVGLDGELEGPRPLRLSGKASFEIFWCSFSVRFDATLLEGEPPPPPPAVDVTAELIKALSTAQSWSTELTGEHTHGVALRRLAPGPALVLDPLGRISVKQQFVPLNTGRDIERFGGAPLAGARRFHVSAMLNGQPQDAGPLQAGFAPAQYFEMSDDEKLAAPAFENMDAGLVFGAEKAQFNAAAMVGAPLQYEQILIDAPGQTPQSGAVASTRVPLPVSQLQVQSGAAARTPLRGVGSRRFANTAAPAAARITAVRWSIAALTDGAPPPVAPDVRSWSEYRATLAALNRGGARWQMVPRHELTA